MEQAAKGLGGFNQLSRHPTASSRHIVLTVPL
jgi:hypothetical protein